MDAPLPPGAPPPVLAVLPRLRAVLTEGNSAVLQAPPGAGKTTLVPPALMEEGWLGGRRMVLLEPRRVAARAAAGWMAAALGEAPGGRVGYRIRGDSRVGPRTRIEVVTEGILTRMLQDDPALEGTGLLLFDEFHERNLQGDLGLALALQSRELLRPDLRIVVMSATLDTGGVAALLGDAPVISTPGRSHPVEVHYRTRPRTGWIEPVAAATVRRVLEEHEGDVLVFLPGTGEIRRTEEALRDPPLPSHVDLLPLHGSLPGEVQDRALRPSPPGRRRVVLSTDLAESSVTLAGVRVVIDGGLSRVPRFDPRSGMTGLETIPVSRASAEQRAGRAGREGPGHCHRLWTEAEQATLPERSVPEILDADLAPLALELALRGVSDPGELRWMDPPPAGALAGARELLADLGALDERGVITPHGRAMASAGVHPRLAHLILASITRGAGDADVACDLAALLEERDLLRGDGPPDPDLSLRLALVRGEGVNVANLDRGTLHRIRGEGERLRRRFGVADGGGARGGKGSRGAPPRVDPLDVGRMLLLAYPDRVGLAREGRRGAFRLSGGRGAAVPIEHPLAGVSRLVAPRLMGGAGEDRVLLAAPVTEEAIREVLGHRIRRTERVEWDSRNDVVTALWEERLGALVLRAGSLHEPDPEALMEALMEGIRRSGGELLPWSAPSRSLLERVGFLHRLDPEEWPLLDPGVLMETLPEWLGPWLGGVRRMGQLSRLDMEQILLALLPHGSRERLERLAPATLEVPSGSRIPLDYGDPGGPVLAVRLQELFGLPETPRVAGGRVPVTLHLLSPARRPVQVTRDLASFWRSGYAEVRKELRARYPKHAWPEDPLTAEPLRGAKRRS
jgi:ATP-dependent helicase HrpB